MWSFLTQPLSKVWGKLLVILLPWLRRYLFNSLVKKAGRGALNKAPLNFHAPNLIVTGISVFVINGMNFALTLWFAEGVLLSLISAGLVTVVTAFFLLRGFFCPHTRRERIVLLIVLLIVFALFVIFRVVIDIPWIALVIKLSLEVIFCFAVMLSELRRLNAAQSKAVNITTRALGISPDGFFGKIIMRFLVPKDKSNNGTENDGEVNEAVDIDKSNGETGEQEDAYEA